MVKWVGIHRSKYYDWASRYGQVNEHNAWIPRDFWLADWDMNTRGKWLDKLYEAIIEDGWGTFDSLRDYWGEICAYPGLAHIRADQLLPTVKEAFTSDSYTYFVGSDMCLSCLLYTERYDELLEVLELRNKPWWTYNQFWGKALVKQGKYDEALSYAEQVRSQETVNSEERSIDLFCESVLIEAGRIEEAYEKYGLKIPSHGTYLNIYRGICKKYPTIDKKKILLDCMSRTLEKGNWFASAKEAGFLDLALECAHSSGANPDVLLRACRDYGKKDINFAVQVGIQGIIKLITETFYEEVFPVDVVRAYQNVEKVAVEGGRLEEFREQLGREIMKKSCKANLREVVVKRLGQGGILS